MALKKKILVIGGGFSGVGAIKSLKEEGFDPICYEKTSHPGGTWFYREDTPMGLPSIMSTTVINHSKEMGTPTNYIPDKRLPNYMRHDELLKMFYDIGEKFDCFRHITCDREVILVKRSADYEETGRWDVDVKNTETGEATSEVYDGIMVCIGHMTYPKMPSFPGMEKFKGKIMHTHSLKGIDSFKNKKVLIVGIGSSALDAAVEISNVASRVYLSTRNGGWILPRVGFGGLPFDYFLLRRTFAYMQSILGYRFASWYIETFLLNTKFNHNLYNLNPVYPVLSKDPVTNDFLPAKVITGHIKIRKDIKYFTEKGVVFENETKITEVDAVIMATGYTWKFPFLEEGIVRTEGGRINLYKCMYPPYLKHPSLVIIGFILPFSSGFPCGDMQCRWAAQVFNGKCLPPSEDKMTAEIIRRHDDNAKRFAPSEKLSLRVDYIQYMDDIASQFGTKPNIWKFLFTDAQLFWALLFGPAVPYQYRLQGPHKWDGARDAILTTYDRVRFPFSDTESKKSEKITIKQGLIFKYLITFLVLAFWLFQSGSSVNYYLLMLFLPYVKSWNGFYKKCLAGFFLLILYLNWNGSVFSYGAAILLPLFLASLI